MSFLAVLKAVFAPSSPRISGREAAEQVAKGALLVDVRSAAEFARGHIDGAINVPLALLPEGLPPQVAAVVLYCASGRRSRLATAQIGARATCFDLGPMSAWDGA